jgi:nicotinamidase-related amidase
MASSRPPRVHRLPRDLHDRVEPATTALVVWDAQVGLAGRATNLEVIQPNIRALVHAADAAGALVVWSRHVLPPLELMPTAGVDWLIRRQGVATIDELAPYMQRGMPTTEFLPGLEPGPEHLVLEKSVPSFFIGTPLDLRLRAAGIRTVVLSGVATEIGIEFTARHALALGYFVVTVEDAVGSYSDEANRTGLEHLRPIGPTPTTSEVVAAWRHERAAEAGA